VLRGLLCGLVIIAAVPDASALKVARGRGGAVATAHPLATAAALKALEQGGNAVDAAVAASFVLAVVEPQSTGVGGGGFAVVHVPALGDKHALARFYDFRESAPQLVTAADYLDEKEQPVPSRSQHHGLAVGTPGFVKGMEALHRAHGKLKWAQVVDPARRIADEGFAVSPRLSAAIAESVAFLSPAAKAIFMPGGRVPTAGDKLVQKQLALTLQLIRDNGADAIYQGPSADEIGNAVEKAGGRLGRRDLEAYRVRVKDPMRGKFFGNDVLTAPPPSAGGAQLLMASEMLGIYRLQELGEDSADAWHLVAEVMRRTFALRLEFIGDESPAELPRLFAQKRAAELQASIDTSKATPSRSLASAPAPGPGGRDRTPFERHANTSHVSVLDGSGMAVATTHTINLRMGSGLIAGDTGILLNNEMDDFALSEKSLNAFGLAGSPLNLVRPGARPVSSMTPVIVLRDGKARLVVGSPGGTRITTAVMLVLLRRLVFDADIADAVDAPRIHHQMWPDQISVEKGRYPAAFLKELKVRGHDVGEAMPWCNVQAIEIAADGKVTAVADPRGEGTAATTEP